MGRYGKLTAFFGLLALANAITTTTTTTTTTDSTTTSDTTTSDTTTSPSTTVTVVPTTVTTSVTTVIDSTTTTVSTETVISTTVTITDSSTTTTDATTVITTTTLTPITTVSDSTTTVTESPTETVTTVTLTPSSSSTSTGSSTTTNAPQYTGATFHIESSEGDLGEGPTESGTTRQNLVFGVRTEFTLDGFGYLVSKADGSVAQTNGGGDTVFTDKGPQGARIKRQATGTPLTCSVGTNGILACTGAMGNVFYTDGTNLYLGAAVPAGFTPITLIAVIDAPLVGTSSGVVSPTGPLPTAGPTTPGYAGWGQWSYPTPTGVPVALTTSCVYPASGGLVTETITITSMHCGCTETPIPTSVVMTTYLTTCPDSWGYTGPVTVVVPVMPTGAVWASATYGSNNGGSGWSAYASGPSVSKPTSGATSGNATYNSWSSKPYTGAASAMGVSAGLLSVSAAMLAFFL